MSDQMTPAEMRETAKRLHGDAGPRGTIFDDQQAQDARAGAAALQALAAIREAWTVPGPAPSLHRGWQHKVRRGWPSLATAIEHGTGANADPTVRLRILRAIDATGVLTDEHDARALADGLAPLIAAERANARGTT